MVIAFYGNAQTIYSSHIPYGKVRCFSLPNVAEATWYMHNDTSGELHFYDLIRKVNIDVNVSINPNEKPVYKGTSDLFYEAVIDLSKNNILKLQIKEKSNSEPVEFLMPLTSSDKAVPFDYLYFKAERYIYYDGEDGRDSSSLVVEHVYPVPAANTNKEDSLRFVNAICSMNEVLTIDVKYPDDIIKNIDIAYIQEYTSVYESGEVEADSYTSNWEVFDDIHIVFQKNGLMGIVSSEYSYLGGAHGYYGSSNYVYDFESQKFLTLDDVFTNNYKIELEKAINRQLRIDIGLKSNELLEDNGFFAEYIEITPNFILSESGITFHYNVYEIACYAAGSFDVTIPYSEIKSVIRKNGLIDRIAQ